MTENNVLKDVLILIEELTDKGFNSFMFKIINEDSIWIQVEKDGTGYFTTINESKSTRKAMEEIKTKFYL